MAYATIDFHHPLTGALKQAPVGFSWTALFFGFFPALIRGHWGGAVIIFLVGFLTFGLSGLVFPFIYNKMYVKHLLGEGFKLSRATSDPADLSRRLRIELPFDPAQAPLSPA
ncbi:MULTISPECIES: hypothetical protein [unclassified Paracoccus (in: a-proteobacteria)]|uniref:hypothetical protein n=1 Tax=unclassified Paracoccus (in: a-proteobacteria) TaxID=2688777 RepID=UPI0016023603|nr:MULTISPECIES: hypothetical protein [unclassified Paracoccus (in: a-proteobacteria)]MBB1491951.1 hypothetical protein [Paracoccus sp. MC1854]MBB1498186.1 hypothetical protein [Paracoccus sp. MC1862]QQO45683.1 hypothetical protein JGR78_04895 [Paracoccus sp. MC1862]